MQTIAYTSDHGNTRVKPVYTDEFRATCVVMLQAAGYPDTPGALERVAKATGRPARTLSRWYNGENNPPPDRIVEGIKLDLTGMLQAAAELHAARIADPDVADGTSARDSAVVMGIAIDKLRLLQELSSDRMAHVRALLSAMSMAGVDDIDAHLDRIAARYSAMAEAAENALLSG